MYVSGAMAVVLDLKLTYYLKVGQHALRPWQAKPDTTHD